MTNIEMLLGQAQQVKSFLTAAEAALAGGGVESSKIGASAIAIEAANEVFPDLINLLAECQKANS
ncbi:hypothetical protein NKH34_25095 [Mesorhizobium sp. M1148]|uniref:hypothetical protein n=1 Tax=unclassified Mesorhizobium TaxID=325217 RepID=UPI003338AF22